MRDSLNATMTDRSRFRSVSGTRTCRGMPLAVSFILRAALRTTSTFFRPICDLQVYPLTSSSGFSVVKVFRPLTSTESSVSCTPATMGRVLLSFTFNLPPFKNMGRNQSISFAGTKSASLARRTSLLFFEKVAISELKGARYPSVAWAVSCGLGVTSHDSRSAAARSRYMAGLLSGASSLVTRLHTVEFSTLLRILGRRSSTKVHNEASAGVQVPTNTGSDAEHFSTCRDDGTVWFGRGLSPASIVALSATSRCTLLTAPPSPPLATIAAQERCSCERATSNSAPPPARGAAGTERSLREKLPHTVVSRVRFRPNALIVSLGTLTVKPFSALLRESNADVGSRGTGFGSPACTPTAASAADRNTVRNIFLRPILLLCDSQKSTETV
eukprot:Hpha_TRINITY_DN16527_c0_g1::TRINITY_DN16527_c0_g1_i5::g.135561::m.135561